MHPRSRGKGGETKKQKKRLIVALERVIQVQHPYVLHLRYHHIAAGPAAHEHFSHCALYAAGDVRFSGTILRRSFHACLRHSHVSLYSTVDLDSFTMEKRKKEEKGSGSSPDLRWTKVARSEGCGPCCCCCCNCSSCPRSRTRLCPPRPLSFQRARSGTGYSRPG